MLIWMQSCTDPKLGKFTTTQEEVSDSYVPCKEKYHVGYTSPKIPCRPRTGSRRSPAQLRHLRLRYKFGAHASTRVARHG